MSIELAFGIYPDLLAHHVVGECVLDGLEEAIREHEDHVFDLLFSAQIRQQLLGIPAVVPCEKLSHLPHRQITLKVDHDVLSEVLDEAIHRA